MALKVNVSKKDREKIDTLMEVAGFPHQHKKYHCTLGFIENSIPEEEVQSFGEMIVQDMDEYLQQNPLTYEVEKVEHIFKRVIAFLPNDRSRQHLIKANQWLFERVSEVSGKSWGLNKETMPGHYTPHMTVWRTKRPDKRILALQEAFNTPLTFQLTEPAFVLF